jgi:hypothetical protein
MKPRYILPLLIVISQCLRSQNCSCADNFTWLKETFEKNDAGFEYALKQKGEETYKKQTEITIEKVKSIKEKDKCIEALDEWLKFFRKGHVWIDFVAGETSKTSNSVDKEKIKAQYKDWEKFKYNESDFRNYVSKLKEPTLEGIWKSSPNYTIGIKKTGSEYIGFIINADGIYWSKDQVKFRIKESGKELNGIYYMLNHSSMELKDIRLLGNNYLQFDNGVWERLNPVFPRDKELDTYFRFMETRLPQFEKLNATTAILRIPSFDESFRKNIDSLVLANKKIITSTENLIIDLRNNGGGSDGSFSELIPLIYTDPIRTIGVEYLSTPLNNKRMEEFLNDPDSSDEDKRWIKEALTKLNANIGKFVSLDSAAVSVDTYDTVYAYPRNVGIIINGGNGSTTEQFLLAAKQSKKVKLFGTTTFGSLDISNMYSVKSPCKDYELGYCLSKSKRIPEFTIDGKGLQPDFLIDKTIPQHEWIQFVNKILNNKK